MCGTGLGAAPAGRVGLSGGFAGFNQPSHVNPVPGLTAIVALGYKELC